MVGGGAEVKKKVIWVILVRSFKVCGGGANGEEGNVIFTEDVTPAEMLSHCGSDHREVMAVMMPTGWQVLKRVAEQPRVLAPVPRGGQEES